MATDYNELDKAERISLSTDDNNVDGSENEPTGDDFAKRSKALQKKIRNIGKYQAWLKDLYKFCVNERDKVNDELKVLTEADDSALSEEDKLLRAERIKKLRSMLAMRVKRIKRLKSLMQVEANRLSEVTAMQDETPEPVGGDELDLTESVPQIDEDALEKARACRIARKKKISKYSILSALLLPAILSLVYFLVPAVPMYISDASFAIRSAEGGASAGSSNDIASVFLRSAASSSNDNYILEDYIKSVDLANLIDSELHIVAHYGGDGTDLIFGLKKAPTQDELLSYWQWAVQPELDTDTGIINLSVRAYTPEMARAIAEKVLSHSEALVNDMNERAHNDAVALARKEVYGAENRVRAAQEKIRAFRDTHTMLDPKTTAQGLQSLVSSLEAESTSLQTQIREAESFLSKNAPVLKSLRQRLASVEQQLAVEKERVAGQSRPQSNLNSIVGDYEDLTMEADFAQKQLLSAMTSLEQARILQASQSRYVVAFQPPTLPDESLWPRPFLFSFYVLLATLLIAGIGSLIFVSIREHAGF